MTDAIDEMAKRAAAELEASHPELSDTNSPGRRAIIARHYRELARVKSFTCSACFTCSFDPCPEGTSHAVSDARGGWMVCGMCQARAFIEKREDEIRELVRAARTVTAKMTSEELVLPPSRASVEALRAALEQFKEVK